MFSHADICYHRASRSPIEVGQYGLTRQVVEQYFDDGEPNMKIPDLHKTAMSHVVYVADWSNPQERYVDLACLIAIAENGPAMLDVVIPFSGSATMERETEEGVLATANTDAKMLSALSCAKRIVFLDLHTLQNKFYFYNSTVAMFSMVPALIAAAKIDDPVICFPDEGAKKRYGSLECFANKTLLFCVKERVGDERVVRVPEADSVKDRKVIVVDDLVRTGGTLIECAKALRAAGAADVVAAVPHAVFPKNSHVKMSESGQFSKFYTTDSVVGTKQRLEVDPLFHIIPFDTNLFD